MPRLVCHACGRQIYTVAPLEALFAEERRCSRCGAFLATERRVVQRRQRVRRTARRDDAAPPASGERRQLADRRTRRRRSGDGMSLAS